MTGNYFSKKSSVLSKLIKNEDYDEELTVNYLRKFLTKAESIDYKPAHSRQ